MTESVGRVSTAQQRRASILVAEDSTIQAELLRRLLDKAGHTVTLASDGKQALDKLRDGKFDLLLTDVKMPNIGGIELCESIRNDESLNRLRIVLVSSLGDIDNIVAGVNAGADNYVMKPYDNDQLLGIVNAELSIDNEDLGEHVHINVHVDDHEYEISAPVQRLAKLLISTYETAGQQNRNLVETEVALKSANRQMEEQLAALQVSRDQLQESDQRFQAVADLLPDIIYRIDADGKIQYVNGAVETLGFKPDEMLGQHISILFAQGEDEQAVREKVLAELKGKETGDKGSPKLIDERRRGARATRGLEIPLVSSDGDTETPRIGEINSIGYYGAENEFLGTVGVVRDITQHKLTEEESARMNEELSGRVEERTRELYVVNQNLEKTLDELNMSQMQIIQSEKLASLGTLIAGVAHELNNPLMAVLNYIQHVSANISDEKMLGYLGKAERDARRAAKIVENMLTYSREGSVTVEAVDVARVVNDTLEMLAADYRHRDISVTTTIADELPAVCAKAASLQQVILNLLTNARDALLEVEDRSVIITTESNGETVDIAVRDSGPGIPIDVLRRIFDPFYTTKPIGKGTGLGLSVSANIVRSFDGELSCESQVGEGTVFHIQLPVYEAKAAGCA